jgi:hypothetical protein
MSPILTGVIASGISGHLTPPWSPEGAYDALSTVTVPSGGLASVTFAGIPNTYKHLQMRGLSRCSRAITSTNVGIVRFNEDASTANYWSTHNITGDGGGAYAQSIQTVAAAGVWGALSAGGTATASTFATFVTDILDYQNPNKYTTTRSLQGKESNDTTGIVHLVSGLWFNTAPINTITLVDGGGFNFVQHSQFTLYGVK